MADAGSFVRVMRCAADIKPVLPSWGSRCCVCASNFPSNLFLPSSLGGTCTYQRRWWREKGDSGEEGEKMESRLQRTKGCVLHLRSPELLFESFSGGFRLSSPIPSFTPLPPPAPPPQAFRNPLQGITRSTSVFYCALFPIQNFLQVVVVRAYWNDAVRLRGVVTASNGTVGSAPFKENWYITDIKTSKGGLIGWLMLIIWGDPNTCLSAWRVLPSSKKAADLICSSDPLIIQQEFDTVSLPNSPNNPLSF